METLRGPQSRGCSWGLGFKGSSFEVEGGWTEGLGSELEHM